MKAMLCLSLGALGLILAGCGGPRPFQPVDLDRDLAGSDVARYESEWKEAQTEGQPAAMATLEHTNGWPLGLLLYWGRGTAMRMACHGGPAYHVSRAVGFGPLSCLYVSGTDATYDTTGKRLSTMSMSSVLLGHLAMVHTSDVLLPNGQRQRMTSMHLLHHILSIHLMDGHTAVSLFSAPNPAGVDLHSEPAHATN